MKNLSIGLAFALVMASPSLAQPTASTAPPPSEQSSEPVQASLPSTSPESGQSVSIVNGRFPPPPSGKGQIVFFRKGGFVGSAISCAVHENGAKVSSLPPGRYFVHAADPGIHNYSVKSEATDTLRLEVETGETYFAQCSIGMGVFAGRPNLSPATDQDFAARAAKLKLVENKSSGK